jgi:hypothetical protein
VRDDRYDFPEPDVDDAAHRTANALRAITGALRRDSIQPSPEALTALRGAARELLDLPVVIRISG